MSETIIQIEKHIENARCWALKRVSPKLLKNLTSCF